MWLHGFMALRSVCLLDLAYLAEVSVETFGSGSCCFCVPHSESNQMANRWSRLRGWRASLVCLCFLFECRLDCREADDGRLARVSVYLAVRLDKIAPSGASGIWICRHITLISRWSKRPGWLSINGRKRIVSTLLLFRRNILKEMSIKTCHFNHLIRQLISWKLHFSHHFRP